GTLLIAVSHSGNTEETLAATEQGLAAGARLVAVASGGRLGDLGRGAGGGLVQVEGGRMPRAALWSLVVPVLLAAEARGVLAPVSADLGVAAGTLGTGAGGPRAGGP